MKKLPMKDKSSEQMQALENKDNHQVLLEISQMLEIYQVLKLIKENQENHTLLDPVLPLIKIENQQSLQLSQDLADLLQLPK